MTPLEPSHRRAKAAVHHQRPQRKDRETSCTKELQFNYPLTSVVVGAPQMTSQPVSSIFPCSPLPSGAWRTPGLSIPYVVFPPLFLSAWSSYKSAEK